MSRADTGGHDLVLAVTPAHLVGLLAGKLPNSITKTVVYDQPTLFGIDVGAHLGLTGTVAFAVEGVTVLPAAVADEGPTVSVAVSATTSWAWDAVTLLGCTLLEAGVWPPPGDAAAKTPLCVVTASAHLSSEGGELAVAGISVTVTIPPDGLEQLPGVTALLSGLASVPLWGDQMAEDARAWLYVNVAAAINGAIAAVLPERVPIATLPASVAVSFGVAADHPSDVLALLDLSQNEVTAWPPGRGPVLRSPIRRAADGRVLDLAAVTINNYWLLRHGVRAGLVKLGFEAARFLEPHPCYWLGEKFLVNTSGVSVSLTNLHGEIDMTGALRLSGAVRGQDGSGGIGVSGTFSIAVRPVTAPGRFTVEIPPPAVSLDLEIAWWLYAIAAMTGGSTAVLITALTDAFAGGALAGAVNGAIAAALPASVGVDLPDVGVQPVISSMTQPDADWQFVQLVMPPVLLPVTRCNDVILGLGTP